MNKIISNELYKTKDKRESECSVFKSGDFIALS